jgi:hypothetical protein
LGATMTTCHSFQCLLLPFTQLDLCGLSASHASLGVLDVDVETGAVLTTPEQLAALSDYALYLAERTAPPTA